MSSTKLTVKTEEKCRDEIREKLRIIREDKKLLDQYKRLGFSQSEDNCKDGLINSEVSELRSRLEDMTEQRDQLIVLVNRIQEERRKN
jgi:hypothetical protein